MSKVQKGIAILLVLLEATLTLFYFLVLAPSYNHRDYVEFPTIDPQKAPTCSLFITRNEAQEFYNLNKVKMPSLLQLDNDHDGKVCENID